MNNIKKISRCILVLVMLALVLPACSTGEGTLEVTPNTPTPTSIPLTPTITPTPSPTPVPTARSLVEEIEEDEGVYRNDFFGVMLEYPTNWELVESSQSGTFLLTVKNPIRPVFVYLSTYIREEGSTFEESVLELFDILAEDFGLEDLTGVDIDPDYLRIDDMNVWRGIQEGDWDGDLFRVELLSIERGGRTFVVWIIGYATFHDANSSQLADIRQSFRLYSPTPYGVNRENALFLTSGEPRTLDPALHQGSAGSIIGDIFSGLVRLDANLQPIPDLAERWEVSSGGAVYTFFLRKNVTFHSGRTFTAQDVIFSWERAANPDLDSPTAGTYLTDILGVQEVIDGEATDISGVRAIDDYTLEVTLDAPKVYFLSKLAYPTSWIVDQETVDEIDDNPIGTGPFKMVKHVENEIMILARNEHYHLGYVPLEYLVYLIYQGYSIRMYEGDLIDMVSIDEELLSRAEDINDPLYGNVHPDSGLCINYVVFDSTQSPFEDPLVREAFARVIDRDRFNEVIYEGKGVIAKGLYPPGLPGYNANVVPLSYDPELALEALSESSYGSIEALPEIIFTVSSSGSGLGTIDALLVGMWEEALGISIKVDQIDYRDYRDEVNAGNHGQILYEGWCADYADPENFADVLFHTGKPTNESNYSNPEIDALLEQARAETDVETRIALYQQIEQMLIDEVAAVFLFHSRAYYVVIKPYMVGYVTTPIGIAQHMNVWIERDE